MKLIFWLTLIHKETLPSSLLPLMDLHLIKWTPHAGLHINSMQSACRRTYSMQCVPTRLISTLEKT